MSGREACVIIFATSRLMQNPMAAPSGFCISLRVAVQESIAAARFVFDCGLDTMFETRRQKPIPRHEFIKRVASAIGVSALLAAIALALGVIGYHHFGELT